MDLQSDLADERNQTASSRTDRFVKTGKLRRTGGDRLVVVEPNRRPHLGSLQIALEITRRAFPTLCHVPDHKINFEVAPGPDMALSGPCITILDDAWEAMVTSPARAMLVSVRESPDEADRRESPERVDRDAENTITECRSVDLGRQESLTRAKNGIRARPRS